MSNSAFGTIGTIIPFAPLPVGVIAGGYFGATFGAGLSTGAGAFAAGALGLGLGAVGGFFAGAAVIMAVACVVSTPEIIGEFIGKLKNRGPKNQRQNAPQQPFTRSPNPNSKLDTITLKTKFSTEGQKPSKRKEAAQEQERDPKPDTPSY